MDGNQLAIVVDYQCVMKGRFPLIPGVYQKKGYGEG